MITSDEQHHKIGKKKPKTRKPKNPNKNLKNKKKPLFPHRLYYLQKC
jgi:hypothetical protein